jgi:hypothetical protein
MADVAELMANYSYGFVTFPERAIVIPVHHPVFVTNFRI